MEHLNKLRKRVIPVLTVQGEGLVKTIKFKKPNYIGDPINAVKIFNDKEVDEIVLLDITATKEGREPNYSKIEDICSEAFMPFAYGGGIKSIEQIDRLFQLGIEKVIINTSLFYNMDLIREASNKYGSQSIIGSIDVKKNFLGKYASYVFSGRKKVRWNVEDYLSRIIDHGVGEVFITFIDREGTYSGYDTEFIAKISQQIDIPLVINGGAKDLDCFKEAMIAGASAVAASSMFVYRGRTNGILINYPNQGQLIEQVFNN